jgi:hypothetical protein
VHVVVHPRIHEERVDARLQTPSWMGWEDVEAFIEESCVADAPASELKCQLLSAILLTLVSLLTLLLHSVRRPLGLLIVC